MEEHISKWHLIYGYIICGIIILGILVCWILSCTGKISRAAFDNFAFASSIVSIVLAVVSIVHSISSSSGVINSVKVLGDAEESIRLQVENLKSIEADIISKVEEGNRGLTDQMSSVQKRIDTLMLQSNEGEKNSATGTPSKKLDVYDLAKNSTIGNVSLYICLKSMETGKSWRLDMLGEKYTLYIWGYLFALRTLPASGFSFEIDNREISECVFSKEVKKQLTAEKIKEAINNGKAKETAAKLIEIIDAHFNVG